MRHAILITPFSIRVIERAAADILMLTLLPLLPPLPDAAAIFLLHAAFAMFYAASPLFSRYFIDAASFAVFDVFELAQLIRCRAPSYAPPLPCAAYYAPADFAAPARRRHRLHFTPPDVIKR